MTKNKVDNNIPDFNAKSQTNSINIKSAVLEHQKTNRDYSHHHKSRKDKINPEDI